MRLSAHPALVKALRALDALDALPADPDPEPAPAEVVEVVEVKTVQITSIPGGDGLVACLFALRDDGSIWGKRVDGGNWWRESDIPTVEASCLPLVKGDGA